MKKSLSIFFVFAILAGCGHPQMEDPMVAIHIYDRNGLSETISNPARLEVFEKVDFLSSQPYQKVLRVYRHDGKNHSKITTYHPNGVPWQYLEAEEMRAHGLFREWHPNGALKIEAQVIGGSADVTPGSQNDWLFDGINRVWNEQGVLIAELPYIKGVLSGKSRYFYDTGEIKTELSYYNHSLEGEKIECYASGAVKAKSIFKNDLLQGPCTGYSEEGDLCWEEAWVEGRLIKGVYYNQKGEVVSEIQNGKGFRAAFDGGLVIQLVEFHSGFPEGSVKNFSRSGELQSTYQIRDGKKHGAETVYFLKNERGGSEPVPKMRFYWDRDSIHGLVQIWYSNGQLQSEREYCRNKKMGNTFAWYRDGSLMLLEEYEDDILKKGMYYRKNGKEPVSSVQNGNGLATLYDEDGILLRKVQYIKGKAVDPEN